MARKKQPKTNDKEQSARFKKVAKEILSEDAEEKFEEAMKKIKISPKHSNKSASN